MTRINLLRDKLLWAKFAAACVKAGVAFERFDACYQRLRFHLFERKGGAA